MLSSACLGNPNGTGELTPLPADASGFPVPSTPFRGKGPEPSELGRNRLNSRQKLERVFAAVLQNPGTLKSATEVVRFSRLRRGDVFEAVRLLLQHGVISRSERGFHALSSRVPPGLAEPVELEVSKPSKRVPERRELGRAKQMLDKAFALLSRDVVSESDRLLSDSCRELARELRLAEGQRP